MGSYVPHTPSQRQAMLETVGAERMEDLFAAVPRESRDQVRADIMKQVLILQV